ncbi:Gfo/Idh/MocA family oxidoreductase [Fulvivirga sp. M361]|uniref:Gfo/Idh/MocA family protein n=1 Tax=Fulvivirga sp. M361 TaxID=2594266 RepID=UPI00117BC15A|nr:Gfo/Idh/MocA family oxidoreductase [Fulvivirga sp. M361]TRX46452.1 Gfo/Idh/MocA family oxidoreductase [Fulvivirga sp. M361]
MSQIDRRNFVKLTAAAGIGSMVYLPTGARAFSFSPNETVNAAIIGMNGRAQAHIQSIQSGQNIKVTHVCDVDEKILNARAESARKMLGYKVKKEKDFRKLLENKDIDAVFIATPEHWHAPMAIMAMQAGKHVYVEKPCSHNPRENELLVEAQKKYGLLCQMGNQQRSAVTSAQAVKEISEGIIGEVYFGKAWYSNTRGSIGRGKKVAVPGHLDWDLWQGPAPREDFRDNLHPYNWHWFKTWGTGEIHNNGTHEIDICRWALGVHLPKRVVSSGGRYHFKDDDWQFYDTQLATFEFDGDKAITWEGRSCNGLPHYGKGRGCTIHGTKGTILLDRENYILYDMQNNVIKHELEKDPGTSNDTKDTTGFDGLTVSHIQNFVNGIREGEALRSEIKDASISTMICHLGNISQDLQQSLDIDTSTGKVIDNKEAMGQWERQYEKGWELKV